MKAKCIGILLLVVSLLLCGCNTTVYEMYQLPKRSEEFTNLQSEMDKAMAGMEYSAPLSGENQQSVQMADLDGDGTEEFLLFAKGASDKPLQIFIFVTDGENYRLADRIECNGTAFEQVEYVSFNGRGGVELVVGRLISDQVMRSVTVYTMVGGKMEQLLTANYSRFLCNDLNADGSSELLLLRPGETESDNGIAELYSFENGTMNRSPEVRMSAPADKIKRILLGKLHGGQSAVYAASELSGNAIITDVYAVIDGVLTNVSLSNESGTSVQTMRNYYVYADDIDADGVLELPSLISTGTSGEESSTEQHIIRWYAMTASGGEVDKMYTYHNFVSGWYLQLDGVVATQCQVEQLGNSIVFRVQKENGELETIMTIYMLTGQKREEMAVADNRFVLHRGDSTVYAARLEVASSAYNMTKESVQNAFHLIYQEWNTGET